jgi:hypothetical protein
MPWDAGAAMDRLQRTRQAIEEMKQRKKEFNWGLLSEGLGKGIDIWKTLSEPKRAEEAAKLRFGEGGSYGLEKETDWKYKKAELSEVYGQRLAEMEKAHGFDMNVLGEEERNKILALREEYSLRATELEAGQDRAKELQQLDAWYEGQLASVTRGWQSGENQAERTSTEGMAGRELTSREGIASADRTSTEGMAGREITSREGMASADRTSTEGMEKERIKLQKELPGIQTEAQFKAWQQKYQDLVGAGLSPMEAEYGYGPSGRADSDAFKLYNETVDTALGEGISIISPGDLVVAGVNETPIGEFLTLSEDGQRSIENWQAVSEAKKAEILAIVKDRLMGAGLKEDDPLMETYLRRASTHMSVNHIRDNPAVPAPINISINMPSGVTAAEKPIYEQVQKAIDNATRLSASKQMESAGNPLGALGASGFLGQVILGNKDLEDAKRELSQSGELSPEDMQRIKDMLNKLVPGGQTGVWKTPGG